jgi:tRNA A37 threonylcarbamoyladenosine dehydratase
MSTLVFLQSTPTELPLTEALEPELPVQPGSPAARERHPDLPADYKLHRRFDRIGRLIGDVAMSKLERSHVIVMGVGGVGSFAAEALVRTGVGTVTLVDFDLVCATNANRQLHTLQHTFGEPKVEVMAERLRKINPKAKVLTRQVFYNAETSDALLFGDGPKIDLVIDAIDNMTAKCHLIATCRDHHIPIVVNMGAAGRLDPTQVRVVDLNRTENDPFARMVRKVLRIKHGFQGRALTGIPAVYSAEPKLDPVELAYDGGDGFRCVCPQGQNDFHSCEHRNQIEGSAGFVTGAFGLAAASVGVRMLLGHKVV